MSNEFFKELSDKYPFVTVVSYAGAEYVGIMQNRDTTVTTLYDFGRIVDLELKQRFLELANVWWWNQIVQYQLTYSYVKNGQYLNLTYTHLLIKI